MPLGDAVFLVVTSSDLDRSVQICYSSRDSVAAQVTVTKLLVCRNRAPGRSACGRRLGVIRKAPSPHSDRGRPSWLRALD